MAPNNENVPTNFDFISSFLYRDDQIVCVSRPLFDLRFL